MSDVLFFDGQVCRGEVVLDSRESLNNVSTFSSHKDIVDSLFHSHLRALQYLEYVRAILKIVIC